MIFLNGILVAYREHVGFPIFPKRNGGRDVVECTRDAPSSAISANRDLPDEWAQTIEQ